MYLRLFFSGMDKIKNNIQSNYIYLRNKETQQTLRVIVSIQYDASFRANDVYP